MNVNKININQSEQTYYIASDIYDVSYHNNSATFASLSALLSDENLSTLIPTEVRCGGMTIRFIQTSINKYVQYRLMDTSFSTTESDWQGVDDEIRRRSVVDYHFSLKNLVLTDTTITFEKYSFIYIKDYNSDNYLRYTLAAGTYDLPTVINVPLYVSLENRDSYGYLIPTISESAVDNTPNDYYMIGYNDAGSGKFMLSDAASVYQINTNNITKNAQSITDEVARAKAAEQANANEIRRRGVVDYHFSLKKLVLTDTTITFESFSFIWIKDYNSNNYLRYILVPGTYDLPTVINVPLCVSLENKDSRGKLIPFISDNAVDMSPNNYYIIGYNDAGTGKFLLSDAASVYQVNARAIDINKQAIDVNKRAIDVNKQAIDIITSDIENAIPISEEIIRANKASFLLDDGTLFTTTVDYICVSDFINIENLLIKNIKAAFNLKEQEERYVAFAFYSDKTEESFISSSRIYNDVIVSNWVLFDGSVAIPEGAKYIRIAGNYGLTPKTPTIEMVSIEFKENIYANAPDSGYEYFTYEVDTSKGDIDDVQDSTDIIYPAEVSRDNGFIRLPNTYTRSGKPTRLVIYSHGAGGRVTDTSAESGNNHTILLLQKKGYAILFVNGVPESMRNTKYMAAENNGAAAHMGSWISLRSTLAAYKYVIEKYNIARDGCFLIGGSMGGLTSLNIAFSGVIPVKALAIDAPVLDSFHDAYFSGNWSGGTLGGKTPAIFAWVFQWDYCDFENDTYTIPIGEYNIFGMSYVIETEETKPLASLYTQSQDMAILWHLNKNKMYGYNAYKTGDFLYKNIDSNHTYNLNTDNDEQYFAKKLPCPCKIWFGEGDTVNQINIAKRFVQKCRNGGSIITLRTCPTTEHTVTGSLTTKPDNVDISVVEDGITCSPFGVELINWLKRWDGNV